MNPRLKKIIFSKLNDDLSKVEIILSENQSIWFIDRANKYWYFELEKSGKLWWRYEFFTDFFILFCIEVNEFQPFLSEWVEGILNSGVSSTCKSHFDAGLAVEDILNRRVSATGDLGMERIATVEGIFDSNVNMTTQSGHRLHSTVESILNHGYRKGSRKVDEVLNHKVVTTEYCGIIPSYDLEEVLNREINEIDGGELFDDGALDKILNRSVESAAFLEGEFVPVIENVLNNQVVSTEHGFQTIPHQINKVLKTLPDLNSQLSKVDVVLNQKS